MNVCIGIATPADDAGIRGLLRREPLPGRIAITYEREPRFSIGCEASGENTVVLVARDSDSGAVAGVACRSEREVYVNGKPLRLGYLGQLRVDRRYRGRWLVARGFSLLKDLQGRAPLAGYLAAITSENRQAEAILVDKPRKLFPAFHAVGDYCTLALRTAKAPGPAAGVTSAGPSDIPGIVRFLRMEGVRRQFFPVWTEARFEVLTARLGLRVENILIVRRGGSIRGIVGVWDQSAYKQNVVRSWSGWMKLAAPLYNAGAPWLGRARIPGVGETIRTGYAAFVCVADDDIAVFDCLLAAALHRAAECGLEYLLLGLDQRDPLLRAARKHAHIPYRSRVFLVEWPEGGHLYARLDRRPTCVEIATL
jgi:hypothetical protein